MPIRSRYTKDGLKPDFELPEQFNILFNKIPAFGTILPRRQLIQHQLPNIEKFHVIYGGFTFSARPAWVAYYNSPRDRVIVVGHILFCHYHRGRSWYDQPSIRLFEEDSKARKKAIDTLIDRANKRLSHGAETSWLIQAYR